MAPSSCLQVLAPGPPQWGSFFKPENLSLAKAESYTTQCNIATGVTWAPSTLKERTAQDEHSAVGRGRGWCLESCLPSTPLRPGHAVPPSGVSTSQQRSLSFLLPNTSLILWHFICDLVLKDLNSSINFRPFPAEVCDSTLFLILLYIVTSPPDEQQRRS